MKSIGKAVRYLTVSLVAFVFAALSATAAEEIVTTWFEESAESFTTAAWVPTGDATVAPVDDVIAVDASGDGESVTYTPVNTMPAGRIDVTASIDFGSAYDAAPTVPEGSKIGLVLVKTTDGAEFYYLDSAGAWAASSVAATPNETAEVGISYDPATKTVKYFLSDAEGAQPIEVTFGSAVVIEAAEFQGAGSITLLQADAAVEAIAKIGTDLYPTFDAAYVAATEGAEIVVLKDAEWAPETSVAQKTVTISGDGVLTINVGAQSAFNAIGLGIVLKNGTLKVGNPFEADPEAGYQIASYDDLVLFKNAVNNNQGYAVAADAKFTLTEGFAFPDNAAWEGIGDNSGYAFVGEFDGNGKTLSNVTFAKNSYRGLFGNVGGEAYIHDLTISIDGTGFAGEVIGAKGYGAGALLGYASGTAVLIENITVQGDDEMSVLSGTHNIAGIAARPEGGITFKNCVNKLPLVTTYTKIAGIVAIASSADYKGAIVFDSCTNMASVTANNGGKDGMSGILGYVQWGDSNVSGKKEFSIVNCANFGAITPGVDGAKVGEIVGGISNLGIDKGCEATEISGNVISGNNLAVAANVISGLNFAVAEGGAYALVADEDVSVGAQYLVTSPIAEAQFSLVEDEDIAFDKTLNTAFDPVVNADDPVTTKIVEGGEGNVVTFECVLKNFVIASVTIGEGVTADISVEDGATVYEGTEVTVVNVQPAADYKDATWTINDEEKLPSFTVDGGTEELVIVVSATKIDYATLTIVKDDGVTLTVKDAAGNAVEDGAKFDKDDAETITVEYELAEHKKFVNGAPESSYEMTADVTIDATTTDVTSFDAPEVTEDGATGTILVNGVEYTEGKIWAGDVITIEGLEADEGYKNPGVLINNEEVPEDGYVVNDGDTALQINFIAEEKNFVIASVTIGEGVTAEVSVEDGEKVYEGTTVTVANVQPAADYKDATWTINGNSEVASFTVDADTEELVIVVSATKIDYATLTIVKDDGVTLTVKDAAGNAVEDGAKFDKDDAETITVEYELAEHKKFVNGAPESSYEMTADVTIDATTTDVTSFDEPEVTKYGATATILVNGVEYTEGKIWAGDVITIEDLEADEGYKNPYVLINGKEYPETGYEVKDGDEALAIDILAEEKNFVIASVTIGEGVTAEVSVEDGETVYEGTEVTVSNVQPMEDYKDATWTINGEEKLPSFTVDENTEELVIVVSATPIGYATLDVTGDEHIKNIEATVGGVDVDLPYKADADDAKVVTVTYEIEEGYELADDSLEYASPFEVTLKETQTIVINTKRAEEPVTPSGTDIEIIVEKSFFPPNIDTPQKKADYLAEKQANDLPRWINHALGNDEGIEPVEVAETASTEDTVYVGLNFEVSETCGLTAVSKVTIGGEGEATEGAIDLEAAAGAGFVQVDVVLRDANGKEVKVAEKAITVAKEEIVEAELEDVKLITVPTGVKHLDGLVNAGNLIAGDKLYGFDNETGGYYTWLWDGSAWKAPVTGIVSADAPVTPDPDDFELKKDMAFWLELAETEQPRAKVFQLGGTEPGGKQELSEGWNLVGVPGTINTPNKKIADVVTNPGEDDQVIISIPGGAEVTYFVEAGVWYTKKSEVVNGRVKKVTVEEPEDGILAPGTGFWFVKGEGSEAEINL